MKESDLGPTYCQGDLDAVPQPTVSFFTITQIYNFAQGFFFLNLLHFQFISLSCKLLFKSVLHSQQILGVVNFKIRWKCRPVFCTFRTLIAKYRTIIYTCIAKSRTIFYTKVQLDKVILKLHQTGTNLHQPLIH